MIRVIGLLVAAVVVGIVVGRPQPTRTPPSSVAFPLEVTAGSSDRIVVHVSGQVVSPGLVEVAFDARVADVVEAAGGVTQRANLLAVNLAQPVVDGQQIVVPAEAPASAVTASVTGSDARVRINDADAALLETLPGVGPVLAAAIVDHRVEYGAFRSAEDLLDVPGIGEQKLASLRDRVIVP